MGICRLTTHEVTAARRAFASAATKRPDTAGIAAFQSRLGVTPDGRPGPVTRGALEDAAALAYGIGLDRTTLRLPKSQYFPGTYEKDLLVMHHTAGGSAASSVASWKATATRVATAYLVERDGTVYEVMPPEAAAGNLGLGGRQETRSIGIEICNYGWLKKGPDGKCRAWTGTVVDHVTEAPWRGERYWETYPEVQVAASINLARYLLDRFGVAAGGRLDADVADEDREHTDFARWKAFRGILSHYHVRADKTDVSPAFPWERLREAIEGPRSGAAR